MKEKKICDKMFLHFFEKTVNMHVERYIIYAKIFIILFTFIWAVLWIIKTVLGSSRFKNNKSSDKVARWLAYLNEFFFYIIFLFVLSLCMIIIFMFRTYMMYIVESSIQFLKKKPVEISGDDQKVAVPKYYLSLTVWMMIYFIVIFILIVIVKITDNKEILFLFT